MDRTVQRSVVAQICNLLYRGFETRRPSETRGRRECSTRCRLQIGDTADYKSALRRHSGSCKRDDVGGLTSAGDLSESMPLERRTPIRRAQNCLPDLGRTKSLPRKASHCLVRCGDHRTSPVVPTNAPNRSSALRSNCMDPVYCIPLTSSPALPYEPRASR